MARITVQVEFVTPLNSPLRFGILLYPKQLFDQVVYQFMALFRVLFLLSIMGISVWAENSPERATVEEPKPIKSPTLHNFFSLSPQLYSSSSPDSEAAFRDLRDLGIKTIISVDGSVPNIEQASNFGIRYIHLPIGYGGTSNSNVLKLIKAAEIADGPVLVHCHHGKHRGPAAAALIAQGREAWPAEKALAWLQIAGTSPDYPGLFQQVANFQPPSRQELGRVDTNFVAKAIVSNLTEAMVQAETYLDHLRTLQSAAYRPPSNHPDLMPANEAVLLAELYRELLRSPDLQNRAPEFTAEVHLAEKEAWELHRFFKSHSTLNSSDRATADRLLAQVSHRCASCHKSHRN